VRRQSVCVLTLSSPVTKWNCSLRSNFAKCCCRSLQDRFFLQKQSTHWRFYFVPHKIISMSLAMLHISPCGPFLSSKALRKRLTRSCLGAWAPTHPFSVEQSSQKTSHKVLPRCLGTYSPASTLPLADVSGSDSGMQAEQSACYPCRHPSLSIFVHFVPKSTKCAWPRLSYSSPLERGSEYASASDS